MTANAAWRSPLHRARRFLPGITLLVGVALTGLTVQAAADGLHGYGDVFAFLGTLALGLGLVATAWEMTRGD